MVTATALSNLTTPSFGLAYLSGYARKHGYECRVLEPVAEGVGNYWPVPETVDLLAEGLSFDEAIERIPADSEVIGFTVMFSAEWPVQRNFVTAVRKRSSTASASCSSTISSATSASRAIECTRS